MISTLSWLIQLALQDIWSCLVGQKKKKYKFIASCVTLAQYTYILYVGCKTFIQLQIYN